MIEAIGKIGGDRAVEALAEIFRDKEGRLRAAAASALVDHGPSGCRRTSDAGAEGPRRRTFDGSLAAHSNDSTRRRPIRPLLRHFPKTIQASTPSSKAIRPFEKTPSDAAPLIEKLENGEVPARDRPSAHLWRIR